MELIAALPLVLLVAFLLFQLGALGYAYTLADGAAEAGALALASDRAPGPAVRNALPGWARERVSVRHDRTTVRVELRPLSPLAALSQRFTLSSTAAVAGASR